jgi:hypothetical protein
MGYCGIILTLLNTVILMTLFLQYIHQKWNLSGFATPGSEEIENTT